MIDRVPPLLLAVGLAILLWVVIGAVAYGVYLLAGNL